MSDLYQLYAIVTNEYWQANLSNRWPDAPLIDSYRVLVFTNKDYPLLKDEFSELQPKELLSSDIISAMVAGEIGQFVCGIDDLKVVMNHFIQPELIE